MKTSIIKLTILAFSLIGAKHLYNIATKAYQHADCWEVCHHTNIQSLSTNLQQREDITFILGEDKEANNPYYAEATNYYAFNPEGKTEQLVTHCRSLVEVQDYLTNNRPGNGLPWGLVNLVSHGNQWTGLSVKVSPDSKRATPERIQEYIDNCTLQALPTYVLDQFSEIFLHGCGIGNNAQLVNAVARAFGGEDHRLSVRASKFYEYYTSEKQGHAITSSQRYMAQAYSVYFKMGYRPTDEILAKQLSLAYPHDTINWEDALSRESPRWLGDRYHFSFEVPVKWVIPFASEDSIPDLSSPSQQLAWIQSQPDLMAQLDEIEIPAEQFNWWSRRVYVNNEDGTRSPAIWLKGYCTILSVLDVMVENERTDSRHEKPFEEAEDDIYYYYARK